MRRTLLLIFIYFLSIYNSSAQNISFTCPKTITVSCGPACVTLNAKFPDLRGLGDDYTFTNGTTACPCYPTLPPGAPGSPTSITADDTYSSVIPLTFNFPFYGTYYNSLVVSTNGYISFDLTRAGTFSHYGILNNLGTLSATTGPPQDLPSSLYDKGLIMGPYHDLDPSVGNSPTKQIKYDVTGTAPNRKFILSFYKEPLYLPACNNSFQNTSQIILNESSGVIEVFVQDQQICPGWNQGHAMIGLQDMTRTKWIMPTGRAASSPPWGTVGMNETWRFIPTNAATLYRSSALLDATGTVIATGDTSRVDVNTFEWNFPNVCPPPNVTTMYVVKTTYERIDNSGTFYSLDTINVLRQNTLSANISMNPTTCGTSVGSITVTPTSGVSPYTYILNGGAPVVDPGAYTFANLAAGPYTVDVTDVNGCSNTLNITVTTNSTITAGATANSTSCPLSGDGTITVTPLSGTAPYTYSLDGGPLQGSNIFTGVAAGSHTITFTDAGGCTGSVTITVNAGNTPLLANLSSTATSCPALNNGTITVIPTSGTAPYQYSLDGGPNQPGNVFINVAAGGHTVIITDIFGCIGVFPVTVLQGAALTANLSSTATSCTALNNGTITVTPTSGTAPYQYSLDGGPNQAGNVFTNVPAGVHNVTITDVSGCTGTFPVTVVQGAALTGNASSTATSCPAVSNGTITVTPTSGTAPYQYSLDGAPNQAGNVFNNVPAGAHNVTITDVIGCMGTLPVTVVQGPALTANVSATATSCPAVSNGTITVSPTSGTSPYQYSLDGGPNQAGNMFTNVPSGPHTITITDVNGCLGTFPVTVVQGAALTSTISAVNPPCSNIDNGTITITPTTGVAPYQYSLNGGPVQGSNVFTTLPPGVYNISFTDVNGCNGTNTITLTTNPPVTATSTLTMPLCNGNTNGSITINASGGVAPYQYSKDAGVTYQASPTFNGLTAGTYTIRVKDAMGCINDFTYTLTAPVVVTASSVSTAATCPNNDGTITITAGGGTPAYAYSINGGVTYIPGNSFPGLPSGLYNNIIVKDANGCMITITQTVPLNDTMRLELGPDSTICFGSSLTLLPQTNDLTDTFRWRPAAGLDYDTAKNPVATPADTTHYILTATWGICQRTDTVTINVLHKPVAFAGKDISICYKTTALLSGSASNLSGTVNFAWSPPDSLNTPNAASTVARPDTTMQFILTVTDNYGCNFSVSDSMLVIMEAPVPAFAGNDTNAVLGKPHQLRASGGTSYLWSPAGPLNNPFIADPQAILYADTYFRVLVTDAIGCRATDDVLIKVYEGPTYYLPNTFTPDGNSHNDIFTPIPVGIEYTDYFMIYNRYGQLLFRTNKWMQGWDGKYQGKDAPMGVYVWMIKGLDRNGRVVEMQGTVMLVR